MTAPTLLRIGHFRAFWVAILVSNLGTMIQGVGAAWLMTSLTNSAAMVALVQSSTSLPIMFLALIGGAIADSLDRRRVMLGAQIFMFVTATILLLLSWLGLVSPWVLLALTFLLGCGVAINNPAWQATVGDLVPRADLASAVALNSVGFNLSRSLGPAIGGVIVAAAGAVASFAVNAASYLMLIVVLWRWKPVAEKSPLPQIVLAAKASRLEVLGGVTNDIRDSDLLLAQCREAAAMGFDGKTLIHAGQIETANLSFSPSPAQIADARSIVALFDRPENAGRGVVSMGGRMVEQLHLAQAQRLLARAGDKPPPKT